MSATAETIDDDKQLAEDTGPKLGIFDDISNEQYHRGPGVSKSGLDLIAQSPAHFIENRRNPKPSTEAMNFGTALHTLILEPEKFDAEYVAEPMYAPARPTPKMNADIAEGKKVKPDIARRVSFWAQWEADNEGKTPLASYKHGDDPVWKPGAWCQLQNMAKAVREHPTASILLNLDDGKAEESFYWVDKGTGKLCRCRTDFRNMAHNGMVVDLKSTNDASYHGFSKSVGDFRYFVQDAFYMDGLRACGEFPAAFVFVAVEKLPPYGVGVYVLDKEAKWIGAETYRTNLELYARCHKEDIWPAYPTDIRELNLSKWQTAGKVR